MHGATPVDKVGSVRGPVLDFVVFAGLSLVLVMLLSLVAGPDRLEVGRIARFYCGWAMGPALAALIPAILPGIERVCDEEYVSRSAQKPESETAHRAFT
jgi:hypothetical protein